MRLWDRWRPACFFFKTGGRDALGPQDAGPLDVPSRVL
jgi:hypothetical protein